MLSSSRLYLKFNINNKNKNKKSISINFFLLNQLLKVIIKEIESNLGEHFYTVVKNLQKKYICKL